MSLRGVPQWGGLEMSGGAVVAQQPPEAVEGSLQRSPQAGGLGLVAAGEGGDGHTQTPGRAGGVVGV